MKPKPDSLDHRIRQLLATPAQGDDPMREALEELWTLYGDLVRRLERITQVSDAYQRVVREEEFERAQRIDRQLRRLQKVARISDRYQRMLQDLNAALKEASTHDHLTGLANRRLLTERLNAEVARHARSGNAFCIALLDIDYFKNINDTHGHAIGDAALVAVAGAIKAALRHYDLCARWGGEEFLILLPDTSIKTAATVIERVLAAIAAVTVSADGDTVSVTASAGLAEHLPSQPSEVTLKQVDNALYRAKKEGRNRYAVWDGHQSA